MEGHRHKARCARQGFKASQAILTPVSSTAPSTTPSEASAPVRSHSVLVGRNGDTGSDQSEPTNHFN
jgi:hypothetical protein